MELECKSGTRSIKARTTRQFLEDLEPQRRVPIEHEHGHRASAPWVWVIEEALEGSPPLFRFAQLCAQLARTNGQPVPGSRPPSWINGFLMKDQFQLGGPLAHQVAVLGDLLSDTAIH